MLFYGLIMQYLGRAVTVLGVFILFAGTSRLFVTMEAMRTEHYRTMWTFPCLWTRF